MSEDETKPPEDETAAEPKATWAKRNFAINENMKHVCRAAIKATETEIQGLKRKLNKLQYGR